MVIAAITGARPGGSERWHPEPVISPLELRVLKSVVSSSSQCDRFQGVDWTYNDVREGRHLPPHRRPDPCRATIHVEKPDQK